MNASQAKQQNDRWLQQQGLPFNPSLPVIEEPSELRPRSAQKVATRAYVLSHVIGVGYGRTGDEMMDFLRDADLLDDLTFEERKFLKKSRYIQSDRSWSACQAEAVHGCAWALGLVSTAPMDACPDTLASLFPRGNPHADIATARLRSFDEIYLRADLNYRLHWAARQARFEGAQFPLPEAYIQLRRHALDWIIGLPYDWDDIPLDT